MDIIRVYVSFLPVPIHVLWTSITGDICKLVFKVLRHRLVFVCTLVPAAYHIAGDLSNSIYQVLGIAERMNCDVHRSFEQFEPNFCHLLNAISMWNWG